MLKNCSACLTKHTAPFGGYCKRTIQDTMAQKDPPTREEPGYLEYLEEQLAAAKTKQIMDSTSLQSIMTRLDKLELSTPTTTQTATTVTTTITSAPLTTTSTWSTRPTVVTGAPWSAPPFPSYSPWTTRSTGAWSQLPTPSALGNYGQPPGFNYPMPSSFHRSSVGSHANVNASDVVNGPLTSVLSQLSQAIEPTVSTTTKGIEFRPEFYVQHVDQGIAVKSLDHTKLTYRELISGMTRVLDHLVTTNGEASSYLEHLVFVTKQASVHSFVDLAYVSYDKAVVDKFIKDPSKKFVAGDTLAVASHFHAGNMPQQHVNKKQSGRGRGSGRGRRTSGYSEFDRDSVPTPEGFPTDICYNYNYRSCSGVNCQKQHICRQCRGSHRAQGCQEKKDVTKK